MSKTYERRNKQEKSFVVEELARLVSTNGGKVSAGIRDLKLKHSVTHPWLVKTPDITIRQWFNKTQKEATPASSETTTEDSE
jgi:hypothetical protein